ncbi:hypothetical protein AJ80_08341 [Polytolypa hystricis UAMH7299]|uniref:Uncharacterized protein n=1 Tax=Polytolypa hystricis (strain UAMH7299) TaxID=1447883 RepID=A0A2B7X9C7_POLH7|nr:hypothetical protein AJ80_08341 [Polytolypa hystricis UAMH7299]
MAEGPEGEDHRPYGWFVHPNSVAMDITGEEAPDEESDQDSDVTTSILPYDEDLRQVIGDLETCAGDLWPYAINNHSEPEPQLSKNGLRSCRHAIATILRWIQMRRNKLPNTNLSTIDAILPRSGNIYLRGSENDSPSSNEGPKQSQVKARGAAERRRRAIPTSMAALSFRDRPVDCDELVCGAANLFGICSEPSSKLKPSISETCKICFPRNEVMIRAKCAEKLRREKHAFYILFIMLIMVIISAMVIVFVNSRKRKAQETSDSSSAFDDGENMFKLLVKRWTAWEPRHIPLVSWVLLRLQRTHSCPDVEDHPIPVEKLHRFKLDVDFDGILNDDLNHERKLPEKSAEASIARPNPLKIRKPRMGSDSPRPEMVPVMPRARSTSVQHASLVTAHINANNIRETTRRGVAPPYPGSEELHLAYPTRRTSVSQQERRSH